METTTVRAELPAGLLSQAEALVEDGWFGDVNDVIVDALRRFLEARRPDLMESHIWQDVEWGLHGED
ncbi:MAG: CopG family transcriptional regulator [Planctomycetaceae bacterium]|nr:MAG: CopG family transcriptional regulator [Planctomycetaceae bacterium]